MIAELIVWYLVFVFSTTCHEFAHAALAYLGGDKTAYEGGQVSLDPIPHIRREPFGMVIVPLMSFFLGGWMLGWASTPFDPRWGKRFPTRQAVMSLAGPMANLFLAAVAFVAMKVLISADVLQLTQSFGFSRLVSVVGQEDYSSPMGAIAMILSVMLNLNVLLGVFNLLPIPPLDGAGVAEGAFHKSVGPFYEKLRQTPTMGLIGLLVAWWAFPYVGFPVLSLVLSQLM